MTKNLLFPGSACSDSCRPDKLPRQWTTRVYYLALTPFEITWVLDSNVYQCPGPWAANAVHNFLLAAQRTALWDYDIAHANQDDGTVMFPHCFSMIWRWNRRSSNVVRDWFMLMLRRGITTSDQEPLRLAESRQAHTADGLRVGQVRPSLPSHRPRHSSLRVVDAPTVHRLLVRRCQQNSQPPCTAQQETARHSGLASRGGCREWHRSCTPHRSPRARDLRQKGHLGSIEA